MQENYENFKIFTAFSRDQDDKCYVQHVIRVRIPIKFKYSKLKFFQILFQPFVLYGPSGSGELKIKAKMGQKWTEDQHSPYMTSI